MKFKLSVKNLMIFVSSIVSVMVVFVSLTQTPDFVLFKLFGYSWGINFTTGAYGKILMVGCWMLTIMISEMEGEKNQENA